MDFDEILKKSLSIVNDGYVAAYDDLTAVVEKVREAVLAHAGEQSALEIKRAASDIKGTTFRLQFDPDVNDIDQAILTITYFQLPSSGYPLSFGTYKKTGDLFISAGEIEDKAALMKFFKDLLEQPESTLIQALGFALRQRKG